jgi:hypothetical protein
MSEAWQERHAATLDHEVAELEKVLVELDNADAIIETRDQLELCTAIRSLAGWLRSEMTTMTSEARALRSSLERPESTLPMHITRRVG